MQKLVSSVLAVAALLVLLLLHRCDPSTRLRNDAPWEEMASTNEFAYNICSLSTERGRDTKLKELLLPHSAAPIGVSALGTCQKPYSRFIPKLLHDQELPGVCGKLFLGEPLSKKEKTWIDKTNEMLALQLNISKALSNTGNCSWVRNQFSNSFYVTQRENRFRIAYAINIDQSPHQVLEFLKVIYRSHNVYCLHVDSKASRNFKQVFFNVASCLDNVIVPRKLEDVYRGWHTLIDAHHNCFSELMLVRANYPWRYVITLCGKELPLRTNAEIVALLEPLNGTSSVQTVGANGTDYFKFKWKWSLNKMTGWITKRDEPLPPIPYGLKIYKSWAYVALSYQFVEHLLCSPVAIALREYMRDVRIPEENFYAMLFMQPGTPGGFRPEKKGDIFPVMSCIWMDGDHHGLLNRLKMALFPGKFCAGTNKHNICMVGARDLYKLPYKPGVTGYKDVDTYLHSDGEIRYYSGPDRGPLFHNKYLMQQDHVIMSCTERELVRRNRLEYEKECL